LQDPIFPTSWSVRVETYRINILEYIKYDPNYNYDEGEESDMECDDEVTTTFFMF
jgi:hypothetical protein